MVVLVPGIAHSTSLGRGSALSMLGYFCVGPYVNIMLFSNPPLASVSFPMLGAILMLLVIVKPNWFKPVSVVFAAYAIAVLYLTA